MSEPSNEPNPFDALTRIIHLHQPALVRLNAVLDLPANALDDDLSQAYNALDSHLKLLITTREQQVDEWKQKISLIESDVASITTGFRGQIPQKPHPSSSQTPSLPQQHSALQSYYRDHLLPLYNERLNHVKSLQTSLQEITAVVPSYSIPTTTPITSSTGEVWEDVSSQRIESLTKLVDDGKKEITERRQQLRTQLIPLIVLLPEVEISLPIPSGLTPSFSSQTNTNANASLQQFIDYLDSLPEEVDIELDTGGLDNILPTDDLIKWAEECFYNMEIWKTEKETEIQGLYDELEPLWIRLEVGEEEMNDFVETNRGSGQTTVDAYKMELERMQEKKRQHMRFFVNKVRDEITRYQDELFMGELERSQFEAFFTDDYSDELLQEHEQELQKLKQEVESKRALMGVVRNWKRICQEEDDLEIASKDPTRLQGRKATPGLLLKEEATRKKVERIKPQLEEKLLNLLPAWEQDNGKPFLVEGERIIDVIYARLEEKEAKKAQRSRAKSPGPPSRSRTPSIAPPSTSRPATQKRTNAASATPSHYNEKRPRLTPSSRGANTTTPASSSIGTYANSSTGGLRPKIQPMTRVGAGVIPPPPGFRSFSNSTAASSSSSSSAGVANGGDVFASKVASSVIGKGYAKTKPRTSFRPRASIAPPPIGQGLGWSSSGSHDDGWLVEEDEGVEY